MLKNLIGGAWVEARTAQSVPVCNPCTGEVLAEVPLSTGQDVDAAASAARKAFERWSRTPVLQRAAVLFRYRNLLERDFESLARLVTRENGKTLEEARGDVRRGLEVVDFACGIGHLAKGECLPQVADQIDAITSREPIGVCAGITPFNFPAMVPMWMFPLAIGCGNTFLLKPSEKVPLTAMRLGELLQEAGLPDGVFSVVHGGHEAVDALCTHPQIAALSFVGSSRVAAHVYALGCRHGKRVQAAGGAKNVLLVMPDADPDATLRAVLGSAYGCAGQRCMAGSVLMAVGQPTGDEWRARVSEALSRFRVADTNVDERADMGPVIDAAAQQRVQQSLTRARAEGADVAYDASPQAPENGFFVGPALVDQVRPGMSLFQDEIFGPVLSLVRPSSLSEAIAQMNRLSYGNGASIFTSSGAAARQFVREMQSGMLGVNVGVPAPMALFSFSGWNYSFFGDLHVQGTEGVQFYTRQKCVLSRWDAEYVRAQGW
jgi:malonate-semialdehyde dehydrogenase (acetylating)/methylmalonate-semialdehyde dehydrogenase